MIQNKDIGEEAIYSESLGIIRIRKDLRSRLALLSKKRKTTLTSLANQAIEKFLGEEEWTFEDIIKIVEETPSLKVHKEIIKEELEKWFPGMYGGLFAILEDKVSFLFKENFDSLDERLILLSKENPFGLYIHFAMHEPNINRVNEIIKRFEILFKGKNVKFMVDMMRTSKEERILLFVSYKKEEKDGKD